MKPFCADMNMPNLMLTMLVWLKKQHRTQLLTAWRLKRAKKNEQYLITEGIIYDTGGADIIDLENKQSILHSALYRCEIYSVTSNR